MSFGGAEVGLDPVEPLVAVHVVGAVAVVPDVGVVAGVAVHDVVAGVAHDAIAGRAAVERVDVLAALDEVGRAAGRDVVEAGAGFDVDRKRHVRLGDEPVVALERREVELLDGAHVDGEAAGRRACEEDAAGAVVGDGHVVGRVATRDERLVGAGVTVVGVAAVAVVPLHEVVAVAAVDVVAAGEAGEAVVAVVAVERVGVRAADDDVVAAAAVDGQRGGGRERLIAGHAGVEVRVAVEAGEVVAQQAVVLADDDRVGCSVAGQRRRVAVDGAGHGRAGRGREGEGRGSGRRRQCGDSPRCGA